jgi:putative PIN family toxin of toxin-antitoxin system
VIVVLDTNVLLAAFATRGLCEAVFQVCLGAHQIVISEYILKELRTHLVRKFKMPAARAAEIESFLREHALLVKPAPVPVKTCRDRADLPVLGTALAGQADFLVTGDKDLWAVGEFQSVRILSPRAFYERLR